MCTLASVAFFGCQRGADWGCQLSYKCCSLEAPSFTRPHSISSELSQLSPIVCMFDFFLTNSPAVSHVVNIKLRKIESKRYYLKDRKQVVLE